VRALAREPLVNAGQEPRANVGTLAAWEKAQFAFYEAVLAGNLVFCEAVRPRPLAGIKLPSGSPKCIVGIVVKHGALWSSSVGP
jgi:hypothetical protein